MKATKKIKFSLGMKIVSILSCLAIVSVGFASWWIVNIQQTTETATGSFEVYTVSTKKVTVNAPVAVTETNIIFGHPGSGAANWLGYTAYDETDAPTGVKQENLTAIIKVPITLTNGESGEALSEDLDAYIKGGLKITNDFGTKIGSIANTYVTQPVVSYALSATDSTPSTFEPLEGDNIPATEFVGLGGTVYVYLKYTFGWGTQTAKDGVNQNPYTFYNDLPYSTENATAAKEMLTAVAGLSGETYKVTIEALANASN